ncbi:hypothetical protein OIDMADRAFT_52159 [Oidiodendron maius Zn]|uniref:Large ribosomal subunit protein uL15/eL18 domain-containing protein n=1 Tax=Oidiodendron maius (strain Zn) TaxID=913774 RepID=A0A0C3H7Q9_OIDMZ|nr:hypothetical protein OIDMADRAFT_52159 [Oidiodendron maius Zn]
MPPRLPMFAGICRTAPIPTPLASFLLPFLQARSASILSSLSDNPGAYNRRIRVGRGPSSGKGKTSGRGHKGQKQHGKVPARFQGGQTPLYIAHGVRGFENQFSAEMSPINLDRIQSWIDQGRLDPTKPITVKELVKSRCLHGVKDGVKLLARGKEQLKTPINILVSRASTEAINVVEAIGGKVITRYYTKQSIKRILRGESESSFIPLSYTPTANDESPILAATAASAAPFSYRLPDPTSRKDIEYYRDPAHRGYLTHLVEDGRGPSLFFKVPGTSVRQKVKKSGIASAGDNKVW